MQWMDRVRESGKETGEKRVSMMEKGNILREGQTITAKERKVEWQTIYFISTFGGDIYWELQRPL